MRKLPRIILPLLVFVFAGVNIAHGDTTVNAILNFKLTGGSPKPTGSFVFDLTTNTFTSFVVNWGGNAYDFASIANKDNYYSFLPVSDQPWCGIGKEFLGVCVGTDAFFLSFDDESQMGVAIPSKTDLAGSDLAKGTYSVTCELATGLPIDCPPAPQPPHVPEPSSLLLLGTALGGFAGGIRCRLRS